MLLTHNRLHALDTELVLEGNGKAMERTYGFSMDLEVVVDFLSARKGAFDKYLCQTVGLIVCRSKLAHRIISTERTNCCAMMARL